MIETSFDPRIRFVVKNAALPAVISSTTLVDDAELKFPMAAYGVYQVEWLLLVDSGTFGDMKTKLDLPAGAEFYGASNHTGITGTQGVGVVRETTTISIQGLGVGTLISSFTCRGVAICGATAGKFQIQFAQNAIEASDTKIDKNSYLIYRRLA